MTIKRDLTPAASTTRTAAQVQHQAHLDAFFSRVDPKRGPGRLIFAIDATASRQPSWDTTARLPVQMFESVAAIGRLDVS